MIAVALSRCFCLTILTLMISTAENAKKHVKVQELYHQGKTAFEKHDYDASILACDKALQLDPKHFASYLGRGHAYRMKHDMERATTDCDEAIRRISKELRIYSEPGFRIIFANSGMAHYLRHLLADAYFGRADIDSQKNDFERALADLNESIRYDPKNANALYYRGLIYQSRMDYEHGLGDFRASAQLDPEHYQACFTLAQVVCRCHEKELHDHAQALEWVCKGFGVMSGTNREEHEIKFSRFALPIHVNSIRREEIEKIRLFVSEDEGKNWKHEKDYKPSDERASFTAPHRGRYWFAVQTVLKNGVRIPANLDGLAPALKVYVNFEGNTSTAQKSCEESAGDVEQLRKKVENLERQIKELQSDRMPK